MGTSASTTETSRLRLSNLRQIRQTQSVPKKRVSIATLALVAVASTLQSGQIQAATAASAEASCTLLSTTINRYFISLSGGASRGEIHVPLLVAIAKDGRIVSEVSGSVPSPPSVAELLDRLSSDIGKSGVSENRFASVLENALQASGEPLGQTALSYPAALLIRIAANGKTPQGEALIAIRDNEWQDAVREWHSSNRRRASCVVLSLRVEG